MACSLKKGTHQNLTRLAVWSQASSLQNYAKQISVAYKPPSLWYFVMAAQTDIKTKRKRILYLWKPNEYHIRTVEVYGILAYSFLHYHYPKKLLQHNSSSRLGEVVEVSRFSAGGGWYNLELETENHMPRGVV